MRKFSAVTAAVLAAAVFAFPCKVRGISAEKAIVMDAVTGRVLYSQRADEQSLIASTTKIMTALVVCEQCNVLDRMRIPKEAVGIEGSSMYLKEGEVLTIQELLYGLMLSSGNDAAVALAIYCGGTVEGFAQLMNDKAHVLGMTDSHFENPHGLDSPGHYSTARDLAVLAAYAMENPIFYKTVSAKTVTAGGRQLRNHNKLLWMMEDADGIKTGYTKAAGRILVSSATRDQRRIVAVTINAPNDWQDHITLLESGFSDFTVRQVVREGECVARLEVAGGVQSRVDILANEDFYYSLAEDEQPQLMMPGAGFVYSPVAEGADAGFVYVLLEGRAVGKVPVVYGQTVELEVQQELTLWERLFGGQKDETAAAKDTVLPGLGLPADG